MIMIVVDPQMAASSPPEGEIDIETADEATITWLAIAIANGLNIINTLANGLNSIDTLTGAEQLRNITDGTMDFTLTGTNTIPLALELGDILRRRENRQFLREVLKYGTRVGKIWTNSAGNLMVSFRGHAGLRSFLKGTSYLAANSKLTVVSTAIKNSGNWAGTLRSVGGRIPMISYVIIGVIDVVEWFAQPEAEQDVSDLIATLFVDIAKVGISTIAGSVAAAVVIAGAVALGVTAPVWGVFAAGVVAAVAVGVALDWVDNAFGITEHVMELADKIGTGTVPFFEWVGDQYESASEATMESIESVQESVTQPLREVERQLNWFDSLPALDQYNILKRMFGGY
ncbi:MAG: hypothetical protein AAFP10_07245 [Pseudomonadota bacterium]